MNSKEVLISVFKKEIGELKNEQETNYGDCIVHALEFLHKNKITLKILLFESEPNNWVIHHNLSKENPFLLKKIVRTCERIQRIKETENASFLLSDDLVEIQKERFIKTAVKSCIQNYLSRHFVIFGEKKIKEPAAQTKKAEASL